MIRPLSIYGYDLNHHQGFLSFDDAFLTMDDQYKWGSLWLIDHEVFELAKGADGRPQWELVGRLSEVCK